MTDKLKLADPNGDLELSKTVIALELEDHQKRLRQVEQNVAQLEKLLAEKKKANAAAKKQRRAASANNKIGARKDAGFKAISTAPSINMTPRGRGMVPVPYPVVQDLSGSVKTAKSVRFNGKPAYLLDQTTQPSCTGDAAGSGGGVKSGTVGGEVKPVEGSRSVRIEGKRVVREGDACTMNGGNNPGIYVTTPATSPAPPSDAIKTSNPPIRPPLDDLDPTGEQGNPLGLPRRPLAEQIRATMLQEMADGSAARRQATAMFQAKPTGPLLVADDGSVEASRRRTGNSLGIALLGPLFGAPGAAARALGANEQQVAASNEVGASLMGVALSVTGLPARQEISLGPRTTLKQHQPPAGQPHDGVKILPRSAFALTKNTLLENASLRTQYREQIESVNTFKPIGVTRAQAEIFFETPSGEQFLKELKLADPSATPSIIYERAIEQISSCKQLPTLKSTTSELVKIVPRGQPVSPYSPYFTTKSELRATQASGKNIADHFGLPIKNDVTIYDIYEITPTTKANVFIGNVAPTTELDGLVQRPGNAVQYIVPNRNAWTEPKLIGTISN